jgi:hypothetical protein
LVRLASPAIGPCDELDFATLLLDFTDELDATLELDFALLELAGVTTGLLPGSGRVAPAYNLIESRRAYAFACVLTSVRLME